MPKFITEEHLKDLYRNEPFQSFALQDDERLTPGGRQYLLDKGIKINSNLPTDNQRKLVKQDIRDKDSKINESSDYQLNKNKMICEIRSLEALFLQTSIKLFNYNIKLTQNIVDLGRYIKLIREFIEGTKELEVINTDNLEKEFNSIELTDIYIHLKNSEELLSLYYLFCKLEELKYEIMIDLKERDVLDTVLKYINYVELTLSEMIKKEAGEI